MSDVSAVQVGGYAVQDWAYHDPLSNISALDINDCHRHPELKRKLYSAYAESDEGELAIPMPRQISLKTTALSGEGIAASEGKQMNNAVLLFLIIKLL